MFKVTNYLELHTTQEDSAIPKGCGTETWEEAVDLALHGWKDGLEHLEVAYKQVMTAMAETDIEYFWDVTGHVFDVGVVLSGEPECWLNTREAESKRTMRLMVNVGVSVGVTTEVITNRGAAIVALIDELQKAGFIVELTITAATRRYVSHHPDSYIQTFVEMGTTPLDMDAVAFALGNPALPRRMFFAYKEIATGKMDLRNVSYGIPTEISKGYRKDYHYLESLLLSNVRDQFRSIRSSADWVVAEIAKFAER